MLVPCMIAVSISRFWYSIRGYFSRKSRHICLCNFLKMLGCSNFISCVVNNKNRLFHLSHSDWRQPLKS